MRPTPVRRGELNIGPHDSVMMVRVPPDKAVALLRKGKVTKVVSGGSIFVNPLTETYAYIPLDVRTLDLEMHDIRTSREDKSTLYNLRGVAQIKVSTEGLNYLDIAQRVLEMTNEEINGTGLRVLEGLIRRYSKYKTLLELSEDRETFCRKILAWARDELWETGVEVRTFVIKEIENERGYFDAYHTGSLDVWLWLRDGDGNVIPQRMKKLEERRDRRLADQA